MIQLYYFNKVVAVGKGLRMAGREALLLVEGTLCSAKEANIKWNYLP